MELAVRRLLYLVHGAPSYYHEAAYSMLSLWRQPGGSGYKIVVVTDDPAPLRALIGDPPQLRYLVFSSAQRQAWQGSIGYVHRMKPNAFGWAIDELDETGDPIWAFIDSDTTFLQAPDLWFDAVAGGSVVLHAQEGTIKGNRSHSRSQRRLYQACLRQTLTVRGKPMKISVDSALWNSGVIGLRASQREVLRETVALIDTMYPLIPIHTVEQVALSLVLQDRHQPVQTCSDSVLHYHTFKEFRGDLARFFAHYQGAPLGRLMQAWPEVDPSVRMVPKREFNDLPKWRRQWRRYIGGGWQPLPLPW